MLLRLRRRGAEQDTVGESAQVFGLRQKHATVFGNSDFALLSSFGIRHSDFMRVIRE